MARKKRGRDIDGVVLIDKPQGISSNNLLQKVKRLYNANKAGHTGALDPLATGMLPICLGEATKFSQFLLDADKSYTVVAKLGERTDTSDADGEVVEIREVDVTEADILSILPLFRGKQLQIPTMFSALKHQGKPLYEYARAGITIEREGRPITIYDLEFVSYEAPFLKLNVRCSKGTYIRTLVDDLGEKLGCGAHVVELRRTAVANYPAESMLTIESLENLVVEDDFSALDKHLLAVDTAVQNLPVFKLDEMQQKAICHGQRVRINPDVSAVKSGLVRLFDSDEVLFLGIAEVIGHILHPRRLLTQNQ